MTESPAATTVRSVGGTEPPETPRPAGVEQRPTSWWGMVLTAMVIATTYAAMYFTVVYIRVSVERWPPEGVAPPALDLATLSTLALAASAVAVWLSVRWMRHGGPAGGAMRLALGAGLLLGAGHVALLVVDWTRVDFGATDHAYGSVFVVIPAVHAVLVGIALLIGLVVLALSFRLPLHHIGARSLGLYWYTVTAGGLLLLALVYLLPHVWAQPWPPAPPPP